MSPAQRVANPSLAAGEDFQAMYKGLDPHMQQMISSHPLVAGGHISPSAALNILHYDKKPGEQLGDVVARTFLSGPAKQVGAAGPSMATRATGVAVPRPRAETMATRAGG